MKYAVWIALAATGALFAATPKAPRALCIDEVCPEPPPIPGKYTIFDNFDSPLSAALWNVELDGGVETKIHLSEDVALSGTRSIKSIITRDSALDFRSEIRHNTGTPAGVSQWNRDLWYGVAVYIPHDWVNSSGRDILIQWHSYSWLETLAEIGTSPVFGMQIRDGNWQIIRRPNPAQPSVKTTQESYTTPIGPFVRGEWAKWVCRLRFHWVNGQSQCWLNGKEVYNVNGGNAPNDKYAPYWLIGNYRVANKTALLEGGNAPRIVYFDNVRVMFQGGSYQAVEP